MQENRLEQFINNPKISLWKLSVPMMLGMSVQAIYTLIDTAFIGMSGEHKVKIDLSWTLTPRERKITIFCDDRIIEFDAYDTSNIISIHFLETMERKKIKYKNDMPLTNMLQYFLNVINSNSSKNYIGNYDLMFKIMKLKLLL